MELPLDVSVEAVQIFARSAIGAALSPRVPLRHRGRNVLLSLVVMGLIFGAFGTYLRTKEMNAIAETPAYARLKNAAPESTTKAKDVSVRKLRDIREKIDASRKERLLQRSSSRISSSSESSETEEREETVPVLEPPRIPIPALPEESSSSQSSAESSQRSAPIPVVPGQIGVYFTERSTGNRTFLLETLDRLRAMTGATLIFDVKGGYVHFAASAPLAKELDLVHPSYDLPEVLRLAKERGIYTIGRFISTKDPNLAQSRPETQIKHPTTGRSVGNVWVDPENPTVLSYNREILEDLVKAGIDEINLDYIRYPTEYLQSSVGLTGLKKADHLERFLLMARQVIDENGGKTKLGISTYAILGWNFPVNFESVGQDFMRFAPLLDVISPMAYPATFAEGAYYIPGVHPRSRMYYLVNRTLTGYRDLLGPQAYKLRPWIQGYGISAKNLEDEIAGVFDAGACGFTLWNASNDYGLFFATLPNIERPPACDGATPVPVGEQD